MFPSVYSTFTHPTASDRLNNPSHSALENSQSSTIGQLEAIIGLDGDSSVLGTIIGDLRSPGSGGGGHVQAVNKGGTGQTSYTKGDLLVATSASVLSKLVVGTDNLVLVANSSVATGLNWATVPTMVISSTITSSVWTKPAAAGVNSKIFVELWGGGGSGAHGVGANEYGGGGGGGYANAWFPASILTSILIAIGAGGDAVAVTTVGLPGGNTVFAPNASLLTAFGGGGGGLGTTGAGGGGGGGWYTVGSSGDNAGAAGGGGSIFGVTGAQTAGVSVVSAILYGGGGGGAASNAITAVNGGNSAFGGAGGGGAGSSVMSAGGVSAFGGNGGSGSIMGSAGGSAVGGSIPGGGGGAGFGTTSGSSSGPGAGGMARITTFL